MAIIKVVDYDVSFAPGEQPTVTLYTDGGRKQLGELRFPDQAPAERAVLDENGFATLHYDAGDFGTVLELLRRPGGVGLDTEGLRLTTGHARRRP